MTGPLMLVPTQDSIRSSNFMTFKDKAFQPPMNPSRIAMAKSLNIYLLLPLLSLYITIFKSYLIQSE